MSDVENFKAINEIFGIMKISQKYLAKLPVLSKMNFRRNLDFGLHTTMKFGQSVVRIYA